MSRTKRKPQSRVDAKRGAFKQIGLAAQAAAKYIVEHGGAMAFTPLTKGDGSPGGVVVVCTDPEAAQRLMMFVNPRPGGKPE